MTSRFLFTAVTVVASTTLAAPRLVVQPVTASAPLPGAANAGWLTAVSGLEVELPSSFEVDDALAALPTKSCGLEARCLARLALATRCRFALAVEVETTGAGSRLRARVVNAQGVVLRDLEREEPTSPAAEQEWLRSFRELTGALRLETLDDAAALATAPPVVVTPRAVEPPPPARPPGAQVVVQPAAPARPRWRVGLALGAGAVAIGAGTASATLALTNLSEARALAASKHGDLLPSHAVERAVALDERTTLAVALGAGAALAASVSLVMLLLPDDAPVSVGVSPGLGGPGVLVTGRFP